MASDDDHSHEANWRKESISPVPVPVCHRFSVLLVAPSSIEMEIRPPSAILPFTGGAALREPSSPVQNPFPAEVKSQLCMGLSALFDRSDARARRATGGISILQPGVFVAASDSDPRDQAGHNAQIVSDLILIVNARITCEGPAHLMLNFTRANMRICIAMEVAIVIVPVIVAKILTVRGVSAISAVFKELDVTTRAHVGNASQLVIWNTKCILHLLCRR